MAKLQSEYTSWRTTRSMRMRWSTKLTKVLDASGAPVQPHFDEFVSYMGDVPIFLWTGHAAA